MMEFFGWAVAVYMTLDVLGLIRYLRVNRYPRFTMIPVFNEAGEATKMEAVQKFTAGADKIRVVLRLAVITFLVVTLTA